VPATKSQIIRELKEGRAAYIGDLSVVDGAKDAFMHGKAKSGREAVKFRDSITRKFVLPTALSRLVFRSDLVKLVEGGAAQFSFAGQNTRTADTITRESLVQSISTRFPSLTRAVQSALRRGDEGKAGGVVVVERAEDLAGTFASKTGRTMEEARDALQMSVSPDGERQVMSAAEVGARTKNSHEFRLAVEHEVPYVFRLPAGRPHAAISC